MAFYFKLNTMFGNGSGLAEGASFQNRNKVITLKNEK